MKRGGEGGRGLFFVQRKQSEEFTCGAPACAGWKSSENVETELLN